MDDNLYQVFNDNGRHANLKCEQAYAFLCKLWKDTTLCNLHCCKKVFNTFKP